MSDESNDLNENEAAALTAVLDRLIPPSDDGSLPGGGELGLARVIWERAPDLRPVIRMGLAALPADFASSSPEARAAALDELAAAQPAFVPGLIFHTYTSYYQDVRVLEGLGMEGRAPHPKGYELEVGDLSLLDEVRRREKLYRDV